MDRFAVCDSHVMEFLSNKFTMQDNFSLGIKTIEVKGWKIFYQRNVPENTILFLDERGIAVYGIKIEPQTK